MRSIKGKELMKLEKWDKRGSRDPDHHEGCMVSRLLGERRNLDRAQIDQKMGSIRGEQTLSAVYNTPIIYSGFQIRAPVGKPFSPFNSHPKHMLWVLKRTVSMRRSFRAPNRALTRILKTGVPEPSLPKSGVPQYKRI